MRLALRQRPALLRPRLLLAARPESRSVRRRGAEQSQRGIVLNRSCAGNRLGRLRRARRGRVGFRPEQARLAARGRVLHRRGGILRRGLAPGRRTARFGCVRSRVRSGRRTFQVGRGLGGNRRGRLRGCLVGCRRRGGSRLRRGCGRFCRSVLSRSFSGGRIAGGRGVWPRPQRPRPIRQRVRCRRRASRSPKGDRSRR